MTSHLITYLHKTTSPVLEGSRPLIAAYCPLPTEPGGECLLPALVSTGFDVLLPVTHGDGTLSWSMYEPGCLARGAHFGLKEPQGPRLPASALRRCKVIVMPALGVDLRGARLGQGAGYYDRALLYAHPAAQRVALVYDAEVHRVLPAEPHDQPVHGAVTETGFISLPSI